MGQVVVSPAVVEKGKGGQLRIFVAGALILGALAYLVLASLPQGTIYYQTVGELQQKEQAAGGGEPVRVAGLVADGSIERDAASNLLTFEVQDGNYRMPVAYSGVVPDIFGPDIEVVVEGKRDADGVFQAQTLLAKCPSRFDSAIPTPGGSTTQ